ncbi:MAG: methyltransferase domain-containing protein [Deltaproteobacteria bacterium]|nr:methyltransferase domain-containing protein [Deltaproteobacteria bacterium]
MNSCSQSTLSIRPLNVAELLMSARAAASGGNVEVAAQCYHKAVKYFPQNIDAWQSVGSFAAERGDAALAQAALAKVSELTGACGAQASSNNQTAADAALEQLKAGTFFSQKVQIECLDDRMVLFERLCTNKRVLHIGCVDYPVFDPANNLHIKLSKICSSLDGLDLNADGLEILKRYVSGNYYTDVSQVSGHYDVVLVPETIEHVDNIRMFLEELAKLSFTRILITGPNAFLPNDNGNNWLDAQTYLEYVHPDHNCWFSPYTLSNCLRKYTDWRVTNTYLMHNGLMVGCLAEQPTDWVPRKIPRRVHFYWGNESTSFMRYLTVYSFLKLNPDWEVNLYIPASKYEGTETPWVTGESYDGVTYRGRDYSSDLYSLPGIKLWEVDFSGYPFIMNAPENYKSDLFRWYILSHEGGLYSDIDILYFRPMREIFFNTLDYVDLDTVVCLQQYGHIIGFLLSSPDNPLFRSLLDSCERFFTSATYQAISAPMVNSLFPTFESLQISFPRLHFCNMPMSVVYALDHVTIPLAFQSNDMSHLKPDTIGIHWYAGHKVSQAMNSMLDSQNLSATECIFTKKAREVFP